MRLGAVAEVEITDRDPFAQDITTGRRVARPRRERDQNRCGTSQSPRPPMNRPDRCLRLPSVTGPLRSDESVSHLGLDPRVDSPVSESLPPSGKIISIG